MECRRVEISRATKEEDVRVTMADDRLGETRVALQRSKVVMEGRDGGMKRVGATVKPAE
jgi:hypothetical protein